MLWAVIVGAIVMFLVAFGIGANDVANAMGTSIGSKVLTFRQAMFIAGIFEFTGAVFLGSHVTDTVRSKIVDLNNYVDSPDLLVVVMFSSLVGAAIWLFVASYLGMPVSTTHSIVGAIIGGSLSAHGARGLDGKSIGFIVLSWIVSPVAAGVLAGLFFLFIKFVIMRSRNPLRFGYILLPILYGITIFINIFFIIYKGAPGLGLDKTPLWLGMVAAICSGLFVAGLVIFPGIFLIKKYLSWKEQAVVDYYTSSNNSSSNDSVKYELSMNIGSNNSQIPKPRSNELKTNELKTNEPRSNEPRSNEPRSNEHQFNEPQIVNIETGEVLKVCHIKSNEIVNARLLKENPPDNFWRKMLHFWFSYNTLVSFKPEKSKNDELEPNELETNELNESKTNELEPNELNESKTNELNESKTNELEPNNSNCFKRGLKKGWLRFHSVLRYLQGKDNVSNVHETAELFEYKTESLFSVLQVLSACFNSFAHGANDVANAVAPFAAIYAIYVTGEVTGKSSVETWILVIGGGGIVLGLALWGARVSQTIGVNLIKVTASRGFCTELASALSVVVASRIGFPVSTTHAQIGAVVSVGLVEHPKQVNGRLLLGILISWLLTIPFAGAISAALTAIIKAGMGL